MQGQYPFLLPMAIVLTQVSTAIASIRSYTSIPVLTTSITQALPPGQSHAMPEPPWARNLNLSAEQRSQLQAIHEQSLQTADDI